ncbi:Demethylsterigmatocystin 6-O-methyltransferase [Lachnellula suecica]|uniref:Demethylsterigmatocystin 6-O-methyltransferase n=1 Tax=Lachnellula suecica TaxID=602035 RepID=A0A8T9C569_9HELO|nr:Demethylsterigmatocystin 6-O-methyltransferase [Lachnellula suecica]
MQHYGYMFTEQLVAKIAADLDIFTILAQSEGPMKVEDIATKTGADPLLLDRILRHLAATYTINEVGESTFAANDATKLLASPVGWGNLMFGCNILNKAFQELPKLLKEAKYQTPDHTSATSFSRAYDTTLPFFVFLQQDPEKIRYFQQSMAAFESPRSWMTIVPVLERLEGADSNAPLFVDVEMMAQNFFEKNQVQGAKIYFIRKCLHDLPDAMAKQVLQHIKDAMSPQSLLFIDEIVLREQGASINVMQLDITMLTMFNARERSLAHLKILLGEVGLKVVEVYKYDSYGEDCILEVLPLANS